MDEYENKPVNEQPSQSIDEAPSFTDPVPPVEAPSAPPAESPVSAPSAAEIPENDDDGRSTRSFEVPTYAPTDPVFDTTKPEHTPVYDTVVSAPEYTENEPKSPKKKGKKRGFKVFCVIIIIIILFTTGACVGYIAGGGKNELSSAPQNSLGRESVVIEEGTVPTKEGITPDKDGKYTADDVVSLVAESVVNITVYSEASTSSAVASGVVLTDSGYIISNDHIYSQVPKAKFAVTFSDGKCYNAILVAGDVRSDLCVLKLTEMPEKLTPAVFTDSSALKAGEEVIAIGSPFGLTGSVTKGVVSAPSRRITSSVTVKGESARYNKRVIQTDAAINSGSSGGALVNMYGQVVGIPSSKIVLEGYESICFAIPSNDAKRVAKSLIENGKVTGRAKLGITYNEVTGASAKINNIPAGLLIQTISEESDLSRTGIKKGDIIVEMNGKAIVNASDALDIIDDSKAGDKLSMKVYIAATGKYKTVSATLLEDDSASSYSNEVPETTTTTMPFIIPEW